MRYKKRYIRRLQMKLENMDADKREEYHIQNIILKIFWIIIFNSHLKEVKDLWWGKLIFFFTVTSVLKRILSRKGKIA